jgi:GNAT superfamily N-acetyltransferase
MPGDALSFTVRPMAAPDAAAVRTIWAARFGGRPAVRRRWLGAALDPDHSAAGLVAESAAGRVVGFSLLEVGGRAYTRRYLGLDVLDRAAPVADRNGLLHLSCVRPEAERHGVGSAFYERRLARLTRRDVSRTFGLAWCRPHTVDSRVLFGKYDFTCLATVDRFYRRTDTRAACPDCAGPCACSAALYTRTV